MIPVLYNYNNTNNRFNLYISSNRQVHAEICGILLGSLEGLQNALAICGTTGVILTPEDSSVNSVIGEVAQRIKDLSNGGKVRSFSHFNLY